MTARTFTLVMRSDRLNNPNRRGQHWAGIAARRAEMRETARNHAHHLEPIHGPADLCVTFTFPDRRPRDLDNVEIKGAIDGAVDAGIITDDRSTILRSVTRRINPNTSPKGSVVMVFEFTPATGEGDSNGTIQGTKNGPPPVRQHRLAEGLTPTEEGLR